MGRAKEIVDVGQGPGIVVAHDPEGLLERHLPNRG